MFDLSNCKFVDREINRWGNNVTVKVKSTDSTSDWGDKTTTDTEHEDITAVINVLSEADDIVKEGRYNAGDLRLFFKAAQTAYLSNGNEVKYNDIWYEIQDIITHRHNDILFLIEVLTKKI